MRYVYLLGEGLPLTVIDSQVVAVLRELEKHGIVFDLFVYTPLQSSMDRRLFRKRLSGVQAQLSGRVRVLPNPFSFRSPEPALVGGDGGTRKLSARRRLLRALARGGVVSPVGLAASGMDLVLTGCRRVALAARRWWLAGQVARHIVGWGRRRVLIHARSSAIEVALCLKSVFRGVHVVADIRGDAVSEYLFESERAGFSPDEAFVQREVRRLNTVVGSAMRGADGVQCVSRSLLRTLARQHEVSAPTRVMPCVADESEFRFDADQRRRLRESLGITNETVLVYAGSMNAYHVPELMFRFFGHLLDEHPHARLLVLTPQVKTAVGISRRVGLTGPESIIRAVQHRDIPSYLSAGDIGLLFRLPHPLNSVASPTKFAEYVLCGLPVLAASGIGDLDEQIERGDVGMTVSDVSDLAELTSAFEVVLAKLGIQDRICRASRMRHEWGLQSQISGLVVFYHTVARPGFKKGDADVLKLS